MNYYRTLDGKVFNLDELTEQQKLIYSEVKSFYDTNPDWNQFSNMWSDRLRESFTGVDPHIVVEEPIFEICQDLESRLGIRQGYTREPDYRDLLADIISRNFKSRYQFCKEMGIDEGYLSAVLSRKKHLSIEKLQDILDKLDHRIVFVEKVGVSK